MTAAVPLSEVAEVNPRSVTDGWLSTDEVDFFPMAAVDAEKTVARASERRALQQVSKGFTSFRNGDVLLAKITPCFENGKISQASVTTPVAFGSTEFHVVRCGEKLDGRYLVHFLRRQEVREDGERKMTGSGGQRRVPKHFIESLEIPLPPPAEQRRIAAILDKADALRTKRREGLAQLDRLAQSIFVEMFGDPATNPRGWKSSQLGQICEVGSSKRVFVEELVDEGIAFYRGTEVGQLGEGEVVQPRLFISHDHYERLKAEAGVPRKGDLLLPSICPDGRIYTVDTDRPFYFKDARVLWIKVGQARISSTFLRHYLKLQFAKNYSKIASGTTFAELKIFALKSLDVHLPPMDLQRRFADAIAVTESQRLAAKSSYEGLRRLFQSLQYRAFRGEL